MIGCGISEVETLRLQGRTEYLMEKEKIIIIGSGVGGLAAGYWLSRRGYKVQILESSDRAGGRMVTLRRDADLVDVGAQFYHSNYRFAFELMEAVDLSGDKRPISGKIQFSLEDGSTCLYDSRIPYMQLLGLRGNLKLYWFVLRHIFFGHRFPLYRIVKDIPEYDNVGVLDLFGSTADKRLRDFLVTPLSMGDNMGLPEWMSLYHFIHRFRITTFTSLVYLARGVASLPEELAKRVPVQYGSPVRRLVTDRGRVVGVEMEKDGSIKRAAHVIVAVDPVSAAPLMPEEMEEQRNFFDSIIYASLPMPVFFLDRPLRKDVWCYFNDPNLERTFMFAVDEWAKAPGMIPGNKSVLTAWSGHPMTDHLINQPDDSIVKRAREDIEVMIPGVSHWIEDVTVVRHPYGVARYPAGAYRKVLDFLDRSKRLKGVSFVGSVLGGTSMEASIASARAAVSRVCEWGGTM